MLLFGKHLPLIDLSYIIIYADVEIAGTALNEASRDEKEYVSVLSRDTDVIVILLERLGDHKNIFMIHPQSGKPDKIYPLHLVRKSLGPCSDVLMAVHAFTGCDTTSAPFRKGKKKLLVSAKNNEKLREYLKVFKNQNSIEGDIVKAGEEVFKDLYGLKSFKSLDIARYFRLKQIIARDKIETTTNLAALPPTTGFAKMHSLRTYLQVQMWYGNTPEPLKWGLEENAGNLQPVGSDRPASPQRLMKIIFCDCKG